MRDFNQMLSDLKVYLSDNKNKSFREFLLLELNEQEFLFFKLMFDAIEIPQVYHDSQTEFFVWYTGYNYIEADEIADERLCEFMDQFNVHLEEVCDIRMGFSRLDGEGQNIDDYELVPLDRSLDSFF